MWEWIQANPSLAIFIAGAAAGVVAWCYSVHYTLKEIASTLKGSALVQAELAKDVADHEVRIRVLEEDA